MLRQQKKLSTMSDVRRFLAETANDLRNDVITTDKARALGYVLSILQRAIESSEIELRLEELEERIKEEAHYEIH